MRGGLLLAVAVVVGVAAAPDGNCILRRAGLLRFLRRRRRFGVGLRALFHVAGMGAADGVDHEGNIGSMTKTFNGLFGGETVTSKAVPAPDGSRADGRHRPFGGPVYRAAALAMSSMWPATTNGVGTGRGGGRKPGPDCFALDQPQRSPVSAFIANTCLLPYLAVPCTHLT